jgi:hypothetical protein
MMTHLHLHRWNYVLCNFWCPPTERLLINTIDLGPADQQGVRVTPWTAAEQQLLEQALKTYPASTPERWDKIAECLSTRSKKDCMRRYKVRSVNWSRAYCPEYTNRVGLNYWASDLNSGGSSSSSWGTDWGLSWFSWVPHDSCVTVSAVRPRPLPSMSFPNLYSWIKN